MNIVDPPQQSASLFGIAKSNRDFSKPFYWGKNQFNSSFPVALACYMGATGLPLVYVSYKNALQTQVGEIGLAEVFRSTKPTHDLYFAFESRYEPFQKYLDDELVSIDLVVCDGSKQQPICPLEIKLTTLPDSTTESLTESKYGTELVIRSATTRYMALSIAESLSKKQVRVRQIFEPSLRQIRNFDSEAEMLPKSAAIVDALCKLLDEFKEFQRPILLQPIWKTIGKSPSLAENCLDTFVWSDFALAHLFLDSARAATSGQKITRQLRSALRLSRFLYEVSKSGTVHQAPIFDGMTYDLQNDKEFSIAGTRTRPLMNHSRLDSLSVPKADIKKIILGGGQKHLSPERRFDAILYFSEDLFDE